MTTWDIFFSWPAGGVWGNLIAAVLWVPITFTTSHIMLRRHHDKKIDSKFDELKRHVTDTVRGPE